MVGGSYFKNEVNVFGRLDHRRNQTAERDEFSNFPPIPTVFGVAVIVVAKRPVLCVFSRVVVARIVATVGLQRKQTRGNRICTIYIVRKRHFGPCVTRDVSTVTVVIITMMAESSRRFLVAH